MVSNSKALAQSLIEFGFHLVSGGSDNHLMLVDLRPSHPDLTGKQAQLALEGANVTLNRNTVRVKPKSFPNQWNQNWNSCSYLPEYAGE